jgi:hypothetical protein
MERSIHTYFSVVLHPGKSPRYSDGKPGGPHSCLDVVWETKVCAAAGNHTAAFQPVATVQLFYLRGGNLKLRFISFSCNILLIFECVHFLFILINLI